MKAPVSADTVLIHNLFGYNSDVVITKSVGAAGDPLHTGNQQFCLLYIFNGLCTCQLHGNRQFHVEMVKD